MQKHAHGGNDILNGGDGNDTLYSDAYEMHQNSVGGNDTLNGGSENDILYGDARTMDGSAQGGNDTFTATNSGNSFSNAGQGRGLCLRHALRWLETVGDGLHRRHRHAAQARVTGDFMT